MPPLYPRNQSPFNTTETGCFTTAAARVCSSPTGSLSTLEKLITGEHFLHDPSRAVYGYDCSEQTPFWAANCNAPTGLPPLQPLLPKEPEQSINCCSDNLGNLPVKAADQPSIAPVALKAQSASHCA